MNYLEQFKAQGGTVTVLAGFTGIAPMPDHRGPTKRKKRQPAPTIPAITLEQNRIPQRHTSAPLANHVPRRCVAGA